MAPVTHIHGRRDGVREEGSERERKGMREGGRSEKEGREEGRGSEREGVREE